MINEHGIVNGIYLSFNQSPARNEMYRAKSINSCLKVNDNGNTDSSHVDNMNKVIFIVQFERGADGVEPPL